MYSLKTNGTLPLTTYKCNRKYLARKTHDFKCHERRRLLKELLYVEYLRFKKTRRQRNEANAVDWFVNCFSSYKYW